MKIADQIMMPLVYTSWPAGMPSEVLDVYERYLETLPVYNAFAGGRAYPYASRCGIHRGCPLSMMIVALIMKPWVQLMIRMHADSSSWQTA